MTLAPEYGRAFYAERDAATRHAARRILGLVRERLPFRSVADAGCGVGTWLAVALELGAESAFGWEGDWVGSDMLVDDRITFTPHDLERPLPAAEPVDLAISLEVAEHLPKSRAEGFVADLCYLAPAVLFSAAMPGQTGGVGHVNLQWQEWWAELFRTHGFYPLDMLRPKIWNDDRIPVWYRQNSLLYVSEDTGQLHAEAMATQDRQLLSVAHPAMLAKHMAAASAPAPFEAVGLRQRLSIAAGIPASALVALARRLHVK